MNDQPNTTLQYDAELANVLIRELGRGSSDFARLVCSSEGAYPTDVRRILDELVTASAVQRLPSGLWALQGFSAIQPPILNYLSNNGVDYSLPEPHPLDFDWRFAQTSISFLVRTIAESKPSNVAVLGAPSLFIKLADTGLNPHLFDKNEHVINELTARGYMNVIECDLFRCKLPETHFDCAIADPPWYLDHYRAFLEAGRLLLKPGGHLLVSVLPRLTRPSAQRDQDEIVSFAKERGLQLLTVARGALEYMSPPFERESLNEEGLHLEAWRRGDLYDFQLSRTVDTRWSEPTGPRQTWNTFLLDNIVVKIKEAPPSAASFHFRPASESGTPHLHSVSRRSPSRARINVWTSRNIALETTRTDIARDYLEAFRQLGEPDRAMDAVTSQHSLTSGERAALSQLLELIKNEAKA